MPFVYQGRVEDSAATNGLYKLSKSVFPRESQMFNKHDLKTVFGYTIKAIHKNNVVNSSIFEDGLPSYLGQNQLIA